MTNQLTHHEKRSTSSDRNIILEPRSWNYAYLGEDQDGRHHHVDRKRERIIVTRTRADRDDTGAVPRFRLRGPVLHTEDIALASNGAGGADVRRWIEFIGSEVCGDGDESGWKSRPVSVADQLQDVLKDEL
ncbi:hypothetical protein C483_00210 [Natrialba hulunbeirensis JCM 10989]|uniref:Uncharacterized protein n=1 Tax=Natrialba hulunbeirensis JCM 10989 TaxID=1227493 RepID=M0AEA0_9EURY|nr:hypothetical protein C483_00210 [Natrialba hulunbeirensis JCM 10989]